MGVVEFAREHSGPLNADLIRVGVRLEDLWGDDPWLTVGDLVDFLEYSDESMAVYRVLNDGWAWDMSSQLLAHLNDFFAMKAWVESGKKGSRPKPIPRPGVQDSVERKKHVTSRTSVPADVDSWVESRRR